MPGTVARPPDENWLGTGVAYSAGPDSPRVWGTAGISSLFAAHTSLQEFTEVEFRDRIRYRGTSNAEIVLGSESSGGTTVYHPANEGQVSAGRASVFAAAIRRNDPPPWQVVLADSVDGADAWSLDNVVSTADGWESLVPASLSYSHRGRGARRCRALRGSRGSDKQDTAPGCFIVPSEHHRIIYRRGENASKMASQTKLDGVSVFVVGEAFLLDHPGLSLTYEESDTTAHVVYWNISESQAVHWYHNASVGTGDVSLGALPPGPAGVFTDAGNHAYAWTGLTQPWLCRLQPFGGCEPTAVGQIMPSPTAISKDISFPASGPSDPTATCGGERCFETEQPFGFAAHPSIPDRLFAVYQGKDPDNPDRSSVFFMWHPEGTSLNNWIPTPALRVNPRAAGDDREYIDPEVSVTRDGTIIATYSAADNPELDDVQQYVAWSTDGGTSFSTPSPALLPTAWDPNDLPFHCLRGGGDGRYFLGEYHIPTQLGARAYHFVHRSIPRGTPSSVGSGRAAGR